MRQLNRVILFASLLDSGYMQCKQGQINAKRQDCWPVIMADNVKLVNACLPACLTLELNMNEMLTLCSLVELVTISSRPTTKAMPWHLSATVAPMGLEIFCFSSHRGVPNSPRRTICHDNRPAQLSAPSHGRFGRSCVVCLIWWRSQL